VSFHSALRDIAALGARSWGALANWQPYSIYVPPYVPHQEINASADEKLECVLMRSDSEAVAINLPDLEPVEKPSTVKWIDPTHTH
jgi:uncharacterized RmlC-like cupin family protein